MGRRPVNISVLRFVSTVQCFCQFKSSTFVLECFNEDFVTGGGSAPMGLLADVLCFELILQ